MVLLTACSSQRKVQAYAFNKGFDFISVTDSFKLTIKEFYRNDFYPYTEGLPYALLREEYKTYFTSDSSFIILEAYRTEQNFTKDSQNKVTGFHINSNGHEMDAIKIE